MTKKDFWSKKIYDQKRFWLKKVDPKQFWSEKIGHG